MNLKDKIKSDQIENQKKNLSNITETSPQLLEKMARAVQAVMMERDNLLKQLSQSQKLFQEQRKAWEEKIQTQNFEMELLQERNNRLESDLRYTERQLSRENKTSNWQTKRIRELEEVVELKNRTLWQQIWENIKPKRKGNCSGRRHKWKKFGKKVLDVVLALGYAVAVCWGVWSVMRWV